MEQFDVNFLALHYVQPMPVNRLQPLLQEDPTLESLSYITPSKLALLLKMNQEKVRKLLENFLQVKERDLLQYYALQNIIPIPFYSSNYPKLLLEVFDPPAVLYCKGNSMLLQKNKKIAIVGSRNATSYSQKCIEFILPELISHDITIVSGLAKGADKMAHEATMKHRGTTIAVLGNGLDHIYPRENENLQREMEKSQLVITEYPPYMRPKKWHFPMRNRIISGLSSAILVTESAGKSGTMSTVDYALNHGRNIFSIPGDIFSPLSKGPNTLIQEGATPIWSGSKIIEETKNFMHTK